MLQNWTEYGNSQTSIRIFKKYLANTFLKVLKNVIAVLHFHTSAVQVSQAGEPGLCPYLTEAPSVRQGPELLGANVPWQGASSPRDCEFPHWWKGAWKRRGSLPDTVQTGVCAGALHLCIQGRETGEGSPRMVPGRACWKCLYLISKELKDIALFQQQKSILCEIPTLAKISPDIWVKLCWHFHRGLLISGRKAFDPSLQSCYTPFPTTVSKFFTILIVFPMM